LTVPQGFATSRLILLPLVDFTRACNAWPITQLSHTFKRLLSLRKNAIFNDFYFRFQRMDQLWLMMSADNSSATAGMADRGAA